MFRALTAYTVLKRNEIQQLIFATWRIVNIGFCLFTTYNLVNYLVAPHGKGAWQKFAEAQWNEQNSFGRVGVFEKIALWASNGVLYTRWSYSTFTYSGSSNFFWFLLHIEILWRNCLCNYMWCTSTFWKCIWFENIGSIAKVMSVKVKKCHLKVLSIFLLKWSNDLSEESLSISTLSYSRIVSRSASAFYALSHGVSKCWHAFCHSWEWLANDISQSLMQLLRCPRQVAWR